MTTPKSVRTYLDPDAAGPLPRALHADDSDAAAEAKTMVLTRDPTQELGAQDMLEVLDPNRTPGPTSTAAETSSVRLPRRYGPSVLASFSLGIAVVLAIFAFRAAVTSSHVSPSALALTPNLVDRDRVDRLSGSRPPSGAPTPTPALTPSTGFLRADGPLVWVDGASVGVASAVLPCGPHEVSVGESGHPRSIEVPCEGEVTVFR